MPDSSGDENDSRTASIGLQRTRKNGSTEPSRQSSLDPISKANQAKNRRRGRLGERDVRDFVPTGGSFSAHNMEADPDSTSSSGSDSSSDEEDSDQSDDGGAGSSQGNPQAGSTAPAINWNKGNKTAIRTTLGGKANRTGETQASQFDAVNGKYWQSRSASVSTGGGEEKDGQDEDEDMEEGEVNDDDSSAGSDKMHESGDSDDSELLDSEVDDSILLNTIGSRHTGSSPDKDQNDEASDEDGYDPESCPALDEGLLNGTTQTLSGAQSKESALQSLSRKYPMAPNTLADLERSDMDTQARLMYYDRNINEIDLQLPVTCTECFRQGHLAEVCPCKECVHCGAWNQHASSFCPSWRRCQRCRQRGHDDPQCPSALKSSASEVPCDLCGSSDHLELECDAMWKFPRPGPSAASILVSISCSHCTSNQHLRGDCPSYRGPMTSSSWTLQGLNPDLITNLNSVVSSKRGGGGGQRGGPSGLKIRGRADLRSQSPDSDDMMSRPGRRPPINRNNANKPNIRIGGNIGKNRNLGDSDYDSRRDYRDRQPYLGNNNSRQRSLSPNARSSSFRGRGGRDSYQPGHHSRSPPRTRGRPPAPRGNARGGGDRGGRGGGRGNGNKRGGGDGYRPMPSAGKKAWDRYRL